MDLNNAIPKNWNQFLRNDANKEELFKFLAMQVMSLETEKVVITTKGDDVLGVADDD